MENHTQHVVKHLRMNDFRFNIEQNTETTWTFVFESNDKKIRIWASDFMDPMGSLFYALRMILKTGQAKEVVSMIDEPQENIWVLKQSKDIIEIEILNFKEYSGKTRDLKKGKQIFSGAMNFNHFLNRLVNVLYPYENQKKIYELLKELIELRRKSNLKRFANKEKRNAIFK